MQSVRRSLVLVAFLLSAVTLSAANEPARRGPSASPGVPPFMPPLPPGTQPAEVPTVVKRYELKYAEAENVAVIVQKLFGEYTRVVTQGGALVVRAPLDAIDRVEKVIVEADQPVSAPRLKIQVFKLEYARPQTVCQLLNELRQPNVRCQPDERTGSIVLSGSDQAMQEAAVLIQKLDQGERSAPEGPPPRAVQIRIVWLITGEKDAPSPPDDLAGVVGDLARMGISELHLAAQTMVSAIAAAPPPRPPSPARPGPVPPSPSGGFTISAAPRYGTLSITGSFLDTQQSEQPRLQLSLEASAPLEPAPPGTPPAPCQQTRRLCSISTAMATPLGEAVVLGAVPTGENKTSVFILQVLAR